MVAGTWSGCGGIIVWVFTETVSVAPVRELRPINVGRPERVHRAWPEFVNVSIVNAVPPAPFVSIPSKVRSAARQGVASGLGGKVTSAASAGRRFSHGMAEASGAGAVG